MGKNKRRSTFGRRRSRSLGALPFNEVCSTIDPSLPHAERLQLLAQYALEKSISKCTQDIVDDINDDNDEFTKQISRVQVTIESQIEDQNLYILCMSCDENKKAGVPSKLMVKFKTSVTKIQEEKKQWDQLGTKYQQELDKKIPVKRLTFNGPVNVEKWKLPDYSSMFEDLSYKHSNILYQVNLAKLMKDKMVKYTNLTEISKDALNSKIERHFENAFADSLQNLIKSCF